MSGTDSAAQVEVDALVMAHIIYPGRLDGPGTYNRKTQPLIPPNRWSSVIIIVQGQLTAFSLLVVVRR